jgi:hypothetical protein
MPFYLGSISSLASFLDIPLAILSCSAFLFSAFSAKYSDYPIVPNALSVDIIEREGRAKFNFSPLYPVIKPLTAQTKIISHFLCASSIYQQLIVRSL